MKIDNRFIITILLLSLLFSFYVGRLVVMGSELKDQAEEYVDDFERLYQEELEVDDLDYGYYDEGLIDEIGYISEDTDNVLSDEVRTDPEETGTKATKGSRSIDPETIDPFDPDVAWLFHQNMYYMSNTYNGTFRDGYVFKYDDFGDYTNTLINTFTNDNNYYRYDFTYYILVSPTDISSWLNGGSGREFTLAYRFLKNSYGILASNLENAQNGTNYNYPSNHLLTWEDKTVTPTPTPDPDDPTPIPEVDQNFLIVCIFALGVIAGCLSSKFILRFLE